MTILFTLREVLDIMEFRLGGLYLQEMRDLRGGGATLAEVGKQFFLIFFLICFFVFLGQLWLRWGNSDRDDYEQIF